MIQENSSQGGDLLICDLNLAYGIIILSFLNIVVPYFHIGGRHDLEHDMTQVVLKLAFLSRIEHGLEHSMIEAVQRTWVIFWHILGG